MLAYRILARGVPYQMPSAARHTALPPVVPTLPHHAPRMLRDYHTGSRLFTLFAHTYTFCPPVPQRFIYASIQVLPAALPHFTGQSAVLNILSRRSMAYPTSSCRLPSRELGLPLTRTADGLFACGRLLLPCRANIAGVACASGYAAL